VIYDTTTITGGAITDQLRNNGIPAFLKRSESKKSAHYSCGQLKPTNLLSQEPDFLAKI